MSATGDERFSVTRALCEADLGRGQTLAGWAGAFVPGFLGSVLPGSVCRSTSLHFLDGARSGDELTFTFTSPRISTHGDLVPFDCRAVNQRGRTVVRGEVEMQVPSGPVTPHLADRYDLVGPDVIVHDHRRYEALIRRSQKRPPIATAVVFPTDTDALVAAANAAREGIIEPILVGPVTVMRRVAATAGIDLSGFRLVDVPDEARSAATAAQLARDGTAGMLMKGSLHTAALLRAVLDRVAGLRGARRVSHVFVLDVPTYPKPLLLSDAVVNIAPSLDAKADICRNAIDVAHGLGIEEPKLAVLSAVEIVDPAIPSTLDAAALCKMADRGQITGAVLDGPLAMDNAISAPAARSKHIMSPVSGQADVLIVPNLEAGNILYKNLTFLAEADAAGVVMGARVPIVLTSRADNVRTRMASAALASILSGPPDPAGG
jgi:phosphate butyryltransferase